MNLLRRMSLSRDRSVTVANLIDKLYSLNGDCEVSVEDTGPRRLSWLHADISRIDAFLRRTVALRPGQPVAIYRTNNNHCFHWFLAIIRAGGIAVPLNPMLTLPEVRRILAKSGTDILVTDTAVFNRTILDRSNLDARIWIQSDEEPETLPGFLRPAFHRHSRPTGDEAVPHPSSVLCSMGGSPQMHTIGDSPSCLLSETQEAQEEPPFPPSQIDPGATVAVFHTSGTSGFPKGAALSSRALLGARSSTVIAGAFLGSKDLALIALPWSHIMAVSIALYGLMAGIRGCFLDRFDVDRALELADRHRITAFVGVPAMFARLVNSNPDPSRLSSVRVWLSASDHLPSEVRDSLRVYGALLRLPGGRRIPPVLINGYGMVELGGLAMMGIDLSFLPGSGDFCFPVPPFKIRVADDNGPVPAGVTGECQISRRGLTPHYWNDTKDSLAKVPDGDRLLTPDGWLRTGDLATRSRLGLIRLVGRMKDVIKSGGYSVYVRELEEGLMAHPAVARAAAFGLPHPEKGEMPAAAVELHPGAAATADDLLQWCRQNLAPYKAPRHIWIVPTGGLPMNHTGKILRRVLRDQYTPKPS